MKACAPILCNPAGNVTDVKFLQFRKAPGSIDVTEPGITSGRSTASKTLASGHLINFSPLYEYSIPFVAEYEVLLPSTVKLVSLGQLSNAPVATELRAGPTVTVASSLAPLKAEAPIDVTFLVSIAVILFALLNAFAAIVVTLSGNTILPPA